MVDAVGKEIADRFDEGLPSWESSPGFMNIGLMLRLRNLHLAYDMTDYCKNRYNLLGNGGHWLPGSNAAQLHQLDLTNALKNSPFAEQIPTWLRETHTLLCEKPKKQLSEGD